MRIRRAIGLLLLLPAAAQAYQWRLGETTNALVLPAGEEIPEEALWTANRLEIAGQAARDLWLLATDSLSFAGECDGDLRLFAGAATVSGRARRNLFAYARGLQLTTGSVVRGEAALLGTTLVCEGTVEDDAWILAQSVTLGGRWGGHVRVRANEIRLAPGTQIAGDLVYTSPRPLVPDASVAIAGAVTRTPVALPQTSLRTMLAFHGYLFLAALLVGMPFVGLFPAVAGAAVRTLRTSPWRVLFAGAATLALGPFLLAFVFMTIVGIPLALLLGGLLLALLYLAHIVIALWLGHMLLRAPGPQTFARVLAALGTGLFILYIAAALPGVAAFLVLPVLVLGTGALVLSLRQRPAFLLPPPLPGKPPVQTGTEPPQA